MLTGLKVSSLACKRVFYLPEYNAKGDPHCTKKSFTLSVSSVNVTKSAVNCRFGHTY